MVRGSSPLRNDLTQNRVKELFTYDKFSGNLTRLTAPCGKVKIGDVVGVQRKDGYLGCSVDNNEYLVHRIIWLWQYGKWPNNEIDHIDGVKNNNSIANLRDATIEENNGNILKAKAHNKLGILGVSQYKNKYRATIKRNKKRYHLGSYATKEEASQVYQDYKKKISLDRCA